MPLANIARATSSELKHHRSSSEPPPRATMITSARPSPFNRVMALATCRAAASPCTAVGDRRSSASGYRRRTTFWMCQTAPLGDVNYANDPRQQWRQAFARRVKQPFGLQLLPQTGQLQSQRPAPTGNTADTCILASPDGG